MPPTRFVVAPLPQAAQPPQLRTSLLRSRKEFKRAEGASASPLPLQRAAESLVLLLRPAQQ
jgi:hypothetical protein